MTPISKKKKTKKRCQDAGKHKSLLPQEVLSKIHKLNLFHFYMMQEGVIP